MRIFGMLITIVVLSLISMFVGLVIMQVPTPITGVAAMPIELRYDKAAGINEVLVQETEATTLTVYLITLIIGISAVYLKVRHTEPVNLRRVRFSLKFPHVSRRSTTAI